MTMSIYLENEGSSPYRPRFFRVGAIRIMDSFYELFPVEKYQVVSAEYDTMDLRIFVRKRRDAE